MSEKLWCYHAPMPCLVDPKPPNACRMCIWKALALLRKVESGELSAAEDRELVDRLTPSTATEIETAIRVVQRINYRAAYGHNPKLCEATNKTLVELRSMKAAADECLWTEEVRGGYGSTCGAWYSGPITGECPKCKRLVRFTERDAVRGEPGKEASRE